MADVQTRPTREAKSNKPQAGNKPLTAEPPASDARGRFMALAAALLGWMFDGAEMGIFSLVGKSAVTELMPDATSKAVDVWFNVIMASFLVGAATGGVVFGWLGDRIGRVRAMTLSVLTYALFTGFCGFAQEAWHLGVLRFIAALGMGGEWSLGVALVMEVWPNKSRAFMAGLIGAAANVGYLLVGALGLMLLAALGNIRSGLEAVGFSHDVAEQFANQTNRGWRVMMIAGTVPAVLTFFIRVFVPESEKWEQEKEKGSTSHWATADLLAVLVGLVGPFLIIWVWTSDESGKLPFSMAVCILATLVGVVIALAGYTYPVVRYFQRHELQQKLQQKASAPWGLTFQRMLLGAVLAGIALLGTWGSAQQAPTWADDLAKAPFSAEKKALMDAGKEEEAKALAPPKIQAREWTLIWLSVGAIVGTIGAAFMGDWMGRRVSFFVLCLLSLLSIWCLYIPHKEYSNSVLLWSFIVGTFTASFYGWLPLYLPELFGTNVRATGQGFSFNFGRILAAIGTLQVGNLISNITQDVTVLGQVIAHGRPYACSVISLVYVLGMIIIWFAPETKGKPLPD